MPYYKINYVFDTVMPGRRSWGDIVIGDAESANVALDKLESLLAPFAMSHLVSLEILVLLGQHAYVASWDVVPMNAECKEFIAKHKATGSPE